MAEVGEKAYPKFQFHLCNKCLTVSAFGGLSRTYFNIIHFTTQFTKVITKKHQGLGGIVGIF
jgi:hypothetical protein